MKQHTFTKRPCGHFVRGLAISRGSLFEDFTGKQSCVFCLGVVSKKKTN